MLCCRTMQPMLRRILRAAEWGSALAIVASCGGNSESESQPGAQDAAADATGADAEIVTDGSQPKPDALVALDAAPDVVQTLEPYPELACSGPVYGQDGGIGFHGQCCEEALCMQPEAGAGCPASTEVGDFNLPGFPPGSGSCACGEVHGPYAPHAYPFFPARSIGAAA